jgi:16S rRNA processing protein RimM
MASTDLITVGKFGRPHGTRGEVRLWLYNEESEVVDIGLELTVGMDGDSEQLHIRSIRFAERFAIVELFGIRSREAAQRLRNLEVHVPRSILPEAEEGSFYQADVIGAQVLIRTKSGEASRALGRVEKFWTQSHHDIMVVRTADKKRVLVPLIGRAVETVDVEAATVVLHPADEWATEGAVFFEDEAES